MPQTRRFCLKTRWWRDGERDERKQRRGCLLDPSYPDGAGTDRTQQSRTNNLFLSTGASLLWLRVCSLSSAPLSGRRADTPPVGRQDALLNQGGVVGGSTHDHRLPVSSRKMQDGRVPQQDQLMRRKGTNRLSWVSPLFSNKKINVFCIITTLIFRAGVTVPSSCHR